MENLMCLLLLSSMILVAAGGDVCVSGHDSGPVFEEQPSSLIYPEGLTEGKVILSCQARASPAASYRWLVNGTEVPLGLDLRYTLVAGSLVISSPESVRDTGSYQCLAINRCGTIVSKAASVKFGYLNDFPTDSRSPQTAYEGAGTFLACRPPPHYPALSYRWFINEFPNFLKNEKSDGRWFVSQVTGNLYLAKAEQNDTGNYFCFTTINMDISSKSTFSRPNQLTVLSDGTNISDAFLKKQISSLFSNIANPRKSTPSIKVRFPAETYRLAGQTAQLECFAYGNPVPKLRWRKVDGLLPAKSGSSVEGPTLTLPDLSFDDEGIYECEAYNSQGSDAYQGRISVQAQPQWLQVMSDSEVEISSELLWSCIAAGKPKPSVRWLRNGQSISTQDRVEVNGARLKISNLALEDSGMYQCVAENKHGTIYSSAELRVQEERRGEEREEERRGEERREEREKERGGGKGGERRGERGEERRGEEKRGEGEERRRRRRGEKREKERRGRGEGEGEGEGGGRGEGEGEGEEREMEGEREREERRRGERRGEERRRRGEERRGEKRRGEERRGEEREERRGEERRGRAQKKRGRGEKQKNYTRISITSLLDEEEERRGEERRGEERRGEERGEEERRGERRGEETMTQWGDRGLSVQAPDFRLNPVRKLIPAARGGQVKIECRPRAAPKPSLFWSRGTELLTNSSRVTVAPDGVLSILNISRADEGKYTCFAENYLGKANSTGHLSVRDATKITLAPSNADINQGENVSLQCHAAHDPTMDLSFSWNLNGVMLDLEDSAGPYHRIEGKENIGDLIILNAQLSQAGVYMCTAQTVVDSASAVAKLVVRGPPGPPGGLLVKNVAETSVELRWSRGYDNHSPIGKYVIRGRWALSSQWRQMRTEPSNIEGNAESARVIGLMPWMDYEFQVIASNILGSGEPSMASHTVRTQQAAPTVAPSGLGGGGGDRHELIITWTPMAREYQNGDGFGYILAFKRTEAPTWTTLKIPHVDSSRYVYYNDSLSPYSPFVVKIRAYNCRGEGPFSQIAVVHSAEEEPTLGPLGINATALSAFEIQVSWDPIHQLSTDVLLRGYEIRYWRQHEREAAADRVRTLGQETSARVSGLRPSTRYHVAVLAYNSAGTGPSSPRTTVTTRKPPPNRRPGNISWRTDDAWVTVRWDHVMALHNESAVLGYKVLYKHEGQSTLKVLDKSRPTVKLLLPKDNSYVVLEIRSWGEGGDGPAHEIIVSRDSGTGMMVQNGSPSYLFGLPLHLLSLLVLLALISPAGL
ncbi:Contactin-2 Axonal glycoprotein TAG-1 [Takifugu flavidus]|uniref:Contactin-3 n=1 Tax=Takifugu flavidus TaxID=433684 RepID=A0A5C6N9V0_9TELE|nr:Contactin-2 Axonal glycoprotein TAG-1 [Takifugu flavidus]